MPSTDVARGCFRSDGNYPARVAELLGVATEVDVSCSGADTRDLRRPQLTAGEGRVPAQLRAVTPGTDLVTVGVGGNDLGLYAALVGVTLGGSDAVFGEARELTGRIGRRVAAVLDEVERRAPGALVLLVGYPRLVEPGSVCPRRLPLDAAQVASAYDVQVRLDRALRRAAHRAGVRYVEVFAASAGHGICSADPWVNGRHTDRRRALAYHPLAAGQQAVAELVVAAAG